MTTVTKQITFKQLMTEFKRYTGKSIVRPVLSYVYYDGESFAATNSHILLKVNKDYVSDIPNDVTVGCLYDPVNMEVSNESSNYPNIERVIPTDCNLSIRINNTLNEIQSYILAGNRDLKGGWEDKEFQFTCQDDFLKIDAMQYYQSEESDCREVKRVNESIMRHNDFTHSTGKEIKFTVRSRYITHALATVKKLSRLSNKSIEFNIASNVRPIVFKQEDVFELLVLPVKTFNQ